MAKSEKEFQGLKERTETLESEPAELTDEIEQVAGGRGRPITMMSAEEAYRRSKIKLRKKLGERHIKETLNLSNDTIEGMSPEDRKAYEKTWKDMTWAHAAEFVDNNFRWNTESEDLL